MKNSLSKTQHVEHEKNIDDYPELCNYEEEDDDDGFNDGYRLDPGFGSWEEVNEMFYRKW